MYISFLFFQDMATVSDIRRVAAMLSIFITLFIFPSAALPSSVFTKLQLPPRAMGPEALAFDPSGQGPYAGAADGRIFKYQARVGFEDYAFDSANRSKALCDGNNNATLALVCGTIFGIGFNRIGQLYIADAYRGLFVAGTNGGLATKLSTSAEGVPYLFPNGLDVHQRTGIVYFTDASSKFRLSQIEEAVANNDATGRLLKYDPKTKNVTVLLRGLSSPSGVAVSIDGSFLIITEYISKTIQKYWLKGSKASTSEILVTFPGRPGNIKRTASGDFWVAENVEISSKQTNVPRAVKINGLGKILANVSLSEQYKNTTISEVNEYGRGIYIGSRATDFVGLYKRWQLEMPDK